MAVFTYTLFARHWGNANTSTNEAKINSFCCRPLTLKNVFIIKEKKIMFSQLIFFIYFLDSFSSLINNPHDARF